MYSHFTLPICNHSAGFFPAGVPGYEFCRTCGAPRPQNSTEDVARIAEVE